MARKYIDKDGELRLYDGTTTPYYLPIIFSGVDLTAPAGDPEVDEVLVLDRSTMGANAHNVEGSDEAMMAPLPLSFSCRVTDIVEWDDLMDWLEGSVVNAHTIVTTKGTTKRDGSNFNPAFADSGKKTCNAEMGFKTAAGTTQIVFHYNEVLFRLSECGIKEAADGAMLTLSGQIYGTIVRNAAFTAGTAVTT